MCKGLLLGLKIDSTANIKIFLLANFRQMCCVQYNIAVVILVTTIIVDNFVLKLVAGQCSLPCKCCLLHCSVNFYLLTIRWQVRCA